MTASSLIFYLISSILILPNVPSVSPAQEWGRRSYNDPFQDFDNSFQPEFDEMEEDERIHNELESGLIKFEDRCLKIGGQEALDQWLKSQEELVFCVMQNFDVTKIQSEVAAKEKTGDLDLVFKKYCGTPVNKTRPCLKDFLKASRRCLKTEDKPSLDITLRMIDSAIDFMCQNDGDRIALFMSENGWDCVQDHREDIMKCVNSSVPELFNENIKQKYSNIHMLIYSPENCRRGEAIRVCVENSLLKCKDPTPSNVVNSLLLSMQKATPCKGSSASYTAAASKASTGLHSPLLKVTFFGSKLNFVTLLVSSIMIFYTTTFSSS